MSKLTSFKFSKKDKGEKEDSEVTRLIKPSPKDKPPRTDKTRRRIKEEDPDVDKDKDTKGDKDLSMNYKDIGGSLSALAKRVAIRFYMKDQRDVFAEDVEDILDEDEDEDEIDESDDESDEEVEEVDDDEADEDVPEEDEEEHEPRPAENTKIKQKAILLYEKPAFDLEYMLLSDDVNDSEKMALELALQLKTNAVPPNWNINDVFVDGTVTLDQRHRFRRHMDNWDSKHFASHLNYFKEKLLNETLTENRSWFENYYKKMIKLIKEQWKIFRNEDINPIDSFEEILSHIKEPEEDFKEEEKDLLLKQAKVWREQLRRTNREMTEELYNRVSQDIKDSDNLLSNKAVWLTSLHYILKGSLVMKKDDDSKKVARAIRSGFNKAAQYRGLKGPLDKDDPLAPPKTKWRLKDSFELTEKDYALIIKEAMNQIEKPFLANDLVDHDKDMANRIALDYSIYSYDDGIYNSAIDAPTYNALLHILQKFT